MLGRQLQVNGLAGKHVTQVLQWNLHAEFGLTGNHAPKAQVVTEIDHVASGPRFSLLISSDCKAR